MDWDQTLRVFSSRGSHSWIEAGVENTCMQLLILAPSGGVAWVGPMGAWVSCAGPQDDPCLAGCGHPVNPETDTGLTE